MMTEELLQQTAVHIKTTTLSQYHESLLTKLAIYYAFAGVDPIDHRILLQRFKEGMQMVTGRAVTNADA